MNNDMVEEEASSSFGGIVKHRHSLFPLGKVIDHNDNVLVVAFGGWLALHEVYAPLIEGVVHDYWMECIGSV